MVFSLEQVFAFLAISSSLLIVRVNGQQDVKVNMQPLRYCSDRRWWGCQARAYPYGEYWENAGMSSNHQNAAFMGIMGEEPAAPRYLAIFSHGQQGLHGQIGDATANVFCGSDMEWKWNTDENPSQTIHLDGKSAAAQFYNDQSRFLPQSDTLFLTIFDPQFSQQFSEHEKNEILDGYASFLDSKVYDWADIEGVVFVGASRGGCFVTRLAQKLEASYLQDGAKVALSVVDPVCKMAQEEYGVTSDTIDNPLNTAYRSYTTDVAAQLSGPKENYCVRNLALGEEISGMFLGVRGWSHNTCTESTCYLNDASDQPYYTQVWANMCHSCVGRQYDDASLDVTVNPILDHLEGCMARFGW
ncbi:expressed unknown protein [Seminavis robusta]|uniref:Uncharacterized protein n=1 Tax=Seminavis robusta TaxID=568900 RepID=A0A9N8DGI2_9STRA|nr:expressed unknown protein [Seminavis robusta]|eukprot:Sro108_g054200.1 n/a (357) ;mRNA; r:58107-59177